MKWACLRERPEGMDSPNTRPRLYRSIDMVAIEKCAIRTALYDIPA